MNTKRFYVIGLLFLVTACSKEEPEPEPVVEARKQPNIIFIMADDHAYQAISAYGSKLINTPNIDRLASEGVRFENAFVGNSICSPSRATLLTGKFSHANGLRDNVEVFDGSQQTLQALMQSGGYQTAMIGKWHLKSEPTGFDHWDVLPDQGEYYNPDFVSAGGKRRIEGYVTDITTDLALDWLANKREAGKPYLLFYHHKAPHREWWPAPEYLTAFHDAEIPEPETLFDNYDGRGTAAKSAEMRIGDHMGLANDNKLKPELVERLGFGDFMHWYDDAYRRQYDEYMNDEQRAAIDAAYGPINDAFNLDDPRRKEYVRWKYRRYMEDYLATVLSIDANLGRLLEYLERTGELDETMIVYTSDQGFFLGEHGWFDKRFMYEESFRTPLIIRWPERIAAGSVREALVQNVDFAPTILHTGGVRIPNDMHGRSLMPLYKADDPDFRNAAYYHYYEYPGIHAVKRHYGIRTERYKLMHFYHDVDEWEMYDLETDPDELTNIYYDPAHAKTRYDMTQLLYDVQSRYGDSPELAQKMLRDDLRRPD